MRDMDVRKTLHALLNRTHAGDPDTLILDEVGLCQGHVRVDVAVVNGALTGYEIKSDRDTLDRLPGQVEAYSKVLDYAALVVGEEHAGHIHSVIPAWWGVLVATSRPDGAVVLAEVAPPRVNPSPDPYAIAQLLWRPEALAALEARGLDQGVRSKPRRYLWARLAEQVPLAELRELVRSALKAREGWLSDSPRT